jgi:hypothetical protein
MRQHRRKQERTIPPPLLWSGSWDTTEERAQGDGESTVRVRRAETQAGQGAVSRDDAPRRGSAADGAGGDAASPVGSNEGASQDPRTKTCHARRVSGPQRNACLSDEAICAGLAPESVLVYDERCEDAQIARLKGGVPLPRNSPHADKAVLSGGDDGNL